MGERIGCGSAGRTRGANRAARRTPKRHRPVSGIIGPTKRQDAAWLENAEGDQNLTRGAPQGLSRDIKRMSVVASIRAGPAMQARFAASTQAGRRMSPTLKRTAKPHGPSPAGPPGQGSEVRDQRGPRATTGD